VAHQALFNKLQIMKDFSFLANAHPAFLENLYQTWKSDPNAVEADWGLFF
jgi:2-oxoglutarate dehydrogenase E1 component